MTTYAEGPATTVELLISATPAQIWSHIADPTFPVQFSDELQEAGWGEHPSGEPGVGSTIVGRSFMEARGEWSTVSYVTAWTPAVEFAWAVRDPEDSAARWWFRLEAQGEQTLLRQHYRIGPGSSGVSEFIATNPDAEEAIIAGRLASMEAMMMANLEGMKTLIES